MEPRPHQAALHEATDNVLVSEHRAWLIEWAWPTRGTTWTDPACLYCASWPPAATAHEAERWLTAPVDWLPVLWGA